MKKSVNISYLRCLLGLVLLWTIILYPICVLSFKSHTEISYLFTSLLFSLPVILSAFWLPKKWMCCTLTGLLTLISIIELTMVDLFDTFLMPGGILSTLWTNPQEASEFYDTNLKEVWRWIPLILLCVASCIVYKRPTFSKRIWIGSALLLLLPVGFIGYKIAWYAHKNNDTTLRYFINNRILNRPPYNIFYASYNAYKLIEQRRMIDLAETMRFGAYREDSCAQKEIYVLAIGESLRYDNVSLNGIYPRSTTPLLEKESNIVLFDNYYSQACITMFSVPMIITRATPTNFELNYAERSIIEPYRECGFRTFTVVNTNLLSYETYLSNGCDSLIVVSSDKAVVSTIDSLAKTHDKLFILCQFLGNHAFYTNYEQEFDIYHPNSNDPGVGFSKEALTNAYDNTILYTDYILSSIRTLIDRDDTRSSLMFVSDHGEGIGEDGGGHGGNCAPGKDEYHVPFIYWWNSNYAAAYPNKIDAALSHKQSKINGDVIFYSACSMADIHIDSTYAQPTWDVLSPEFQEHQRLIIVADGVTTINPDK